MVKQLFKHYVTCYYNAVDEMCRSNGDMTSKNLFVKSGKANIINSIMPYKVRGCDYTASYFILDIIVTKRFCV